MLTQLARRVASWPVVARPSALILDRLGHTHLARRIAYKGDRTMPEVVIEPFMSGSIAMLSCGGKDQVARRLWMRGWQSFEAPLPFVFAHLAKRSTHVLDVGANTGFYSIIASLSNPQATVQAFEPVPSIAALIRRNLDLNKVTNVAVHQKAVGAEAGRFKMYLPLDDHGLIETSASLNPTFRAAHSTEIETEVVKLDDVVDSADLIKVDVESLEALVLAGGADLIRRAQPIITLEVLAEDAELTRHIVELDYVTVLMTSGEFALSRTFGPSSSSPNQLLWPTRKLSELSAFAEEIGFRLIA